MPSPPPSVEVQLDRLLEELDLLARQEKPLEGAVIDRVRGLLAEFPAARARLLRVARGQEQTPYGQPWSARLRWFAIDRLRHWPVPGYAEALVEAIEGWPEDLALYGAVVAMRYQKVADTTGRERLRVALRRRLETKLESDAWRDHLFTNQLVGQVLATFGSHAQAGDLDLLGHFGLGDYEFPVRSNALEAARRVACRHVGDESTEIFFRTWAERIGTRCIELANNRRAGEYVGSLLWSTVALLVCRLGEESRLLNWLKAVVLESAVSGEDLRREVDEAESYLRQIRQTVWVESRRPTLEALRRLLPGAEAE